MRCWRIDLKEYVAVAGGSRDLPPENGSENGLWTWVIFAVTRSQEG